MLRAHLSGPVIVHELSLVVGSLEPEVRVALATRRMLRVAEVEVQRVREEARVRELVLLRQRLVRLPSAGHRDQTDETSPAHQPHTERGLSLSQKWNATEWP